MNKALVGYTGFVGGNLCKSCGFDGLYNSKNINEAFGTRPNLLVYAGIRAEKYKANAHPIEDMEAMKEAVQNIERIAPRRLVLISTIDVFSSSIGADEDTVPDGNGVYGKDRAYLESEVRSLYPSALIMRLPALFGEGLKKNFIYDILHPLPSTLAKDKILCLKDELNKAGSSIDLYSYYTEGTDGFFWLNGTVGKESGERLVSALENIGFSSLDFTDSRSVFQFYPLYRLYDDMMRAIEEGLTTCHLAVEPVEASKMYKYITGKTWKNETKKGPVHYGYITKYAAVFGKEGKYIMSKDEVLEEMKKFYKGEKRI